MDYRKNFPHLIPGGNRNWVRTEITAREGRKIVARLKVGPNWGGQNFFQGRWVRNCWKERGLCRFKGVGELKGWGVHIFPGIEGIGTGKDFTWRKLPKFLRW